MAISKGPQFNAPQEAPTLLEMVATRDNMNSDQLIPESTYRYLAKSGEREDYEVAAGVKASAPVGAAVYVASPKMRKYHEAVEDDPGALFSYTPAKVEGWASSNERTGSMAMSLLGKADKDMETRHGVSLEPSRDLSPFSHRIVQKLAKRGIVSSAPKGPTNDNSFSTMARTLATTEKVHGDLEQSPVSMTVMNIGSNGTHTDTAMPAVPLEPALAEGRKQLIKKLRGPKQAPVVPRISQGVQERLF